MFYLQERIHFTPPVSEFLGLPVLMQGGLRRGDPPGAPSSSKRYATLAPFAHGRDGWIALKRHLLPMRDIADRRNTWCIIGLLSSLLFVYDAFAGTLMGKVVRVTDGDTITILDSAKRQHRIRLDGIDAPERAQAFGRRSRESLADLCAGKAAGVAPQGMDPYGRVIGRVTCGNVDANSEQVRRGMAWVFDRYVPSDSPLYRLQTEAQRIKRGLWADHRPVPPWEWRNDRRRHRKRSATTTER